MRFCFINMPIEYYSPVSGGAIATIIAKTGEVLIAAGHEVTVLTPTNGDEEYNIGEVHSIRIKTRKDLSFVSRRISGVRKRFGRWDWPYFEHYLKSILARLKQIKPPDVVILFNDLFSSPHVRRMLPDARIAVWLQNECRTDARNIPITIRATDFFLSCSTYIRDWTSATHHISINKFAVVPSGVDLTAMFPRPAGAKAGHAVKVLFVGRIDRNKGPDIACDAVAVMKTEGLAVELTVAGGLWFYSDRDPMTDPFFRDLNKKMKEINACYLGHVERAHVPELVRDHDIVCVLSRSNEPFGLVTLEAMASGCAVVASNRGGLPEACGGAAKLVDPDDFQAVSDALRELVSNPIELAAYKRRSVERASRASWKVTADRLLDVTSSSTLHA